tara:strand:- start:7860 stop:8021 length:162 start_codon:yes stop_codon:yes gene_type:complete
MHDLQVIKAMNAGDLCRRLARPDAKPQRTPEEIERDLKAATERRERLNAPEYR